MMIIKLICTYDWRFFVDYHSGYIFQCFSSQGNFDLQDFIIMMQYKYSSKSSHKKRIGRGWKVKFLACTRSKFNSGALLATPVCFKCPIHPLTNFPLSLSLLLSIYLSSSIQLIPSAICWIFHASTPTDYLPITVRISLPEKKKQNTYRDKKEIKNKQNKNVKCKAKRDFKKPGNARIKKKFKNE